jgi:hypothetical protein
MRRGRRFTLITRHLCGAILWLDGQMFLWPPWRCPVSCALSGKRKDVDINTGLRVKYLSFLSDFNQI